MHYAFNVMMYRTKSLVLIFGGRTRAPSLLCSQGRLTLILNYQVLQQEAILGRAQIVPDLTMEGGVSHKIQDPEQRVKTSRCSLSLVSQI